MQVSSAAALLCAELCPPDRRSGLKEKMPRKVNDEKADGAKLISFYFPGLMEGDCYLWKHKRPWGSFRTAIDLQQLQHGHREHSRSTTGTEIRTWCSAPCIPKGTRRKQQGKDGFQNPDCTGGKLRSGCSNAWDSTFLRKKGLSHELRGHPTRD